MNMLAEIVRIRHQLRRRRMQNSEMDRVGLSGTIKVSGEPNREDDEGTWVTINGTHVEIDKETGGITKGPKNLKDYSEKKKGIKAAGRKAIDTAKSKCDDLKKKMDKAEAAEKEWEDKEYLARLDVAFAKGHINIVEDNLKKAKAELKKYDSGRSDEELDKAIKDTQKEMDELLEWIDAHPREHGEPHEQYLERRHKRELYSDAMNRYLNASSEKHAREDLKKAEADYHETVAKLEAAEKEHERIKAEEPKAYQKAREEYNKAAKERNEAVLKTFKTADDCETSQDATDYIRAREYFDQSEGYHKSDKNTDLTKMSPEMAIAHARTLDRFFGDYPGLKGRFEGIDCRDMSKEPGYESTYGYASGTMVSLNTKYFGPGGKGKESYEKDCHDFKLSHNGFHPKGTSVEAVLDHEFTHAIEALLNKWLGNGQKASDIIMQRAQEKMTGYYARSNEDYVRAQVSGYARENRGVKPDGKGGATVDKAYGANTEFIAEAMADARNNKAPALYSYAVREVMEEMMKEAGLI